MKKLLLVFAVITFCFSCDRIEDDARMQYLKGETLMTTPVTKYQDRKSVLLEDYTGWKCVNCPRAAAKATELLAKYGDRLIVMAVHSGSFAIPNSANNNLDFRTPYGEQWVNDFHATAMPAGVINRNVFNGSWIVSDGEWDTKIQEQIDTKPNLINLNLGAEVRDTNILVSIKSEILQDIDQPLKITILVVESGIIGMQLNAESAYGHVPKIDNYEFNHVLRKEGYVDYPLSSEQIKRGQTINKNYLLDIDPDIMDIHRCKVIVFVTQQGSREILQVNEIDL